MNENIDNLDRIVTSMGITAQTQTPTENSNDDTGNGANNFYDHVLNSVKYYDSKLRRRYKELEFPAVILRTRSLTLEELKQRTCLEFSQKISKGGDVKSRFYEVYAHVPEISGLLPQPTLKQMLDYQTNGLKGEEKECYEIITSRYPKFYCKHIRAPQIFEVHRVEFPDENFFYYGLMEKDSLVHGSGKLKAAQIATQGIREQLEADPYGTGNTIGTMLS